MNKYLFYPFASQYYDDNSFYYSIINSCIYKQLLIPSICNLTKNNNLSKEDLIKSSGLNMKNGNNIKKLFENGGILIVNHPIVKNHSFLMIKDDNKYVLINSWFGPTILIDVEKETIEQVFNIIEGWYFI